MFGGLGNDFVFQAGGGGSPTWFGNEGNDTMDAAGIRTRSTLVGGNDSADGADLLVSGNGADIIFGNGGDDTIDAGTGTIPWSAASATTRIIAGVATDLIFANESDDTVSAGDGANTVFGGLGNDIDPRRRRARDAAGQRGQRHDPRRCRAGISIDTIAGGSGNDVFAYRTRGGDGDNATGGGPVELRSPTSTGRLIKFQTVCARSTSRPTSGPAPEATSRPRPTTRIAAAFALGGGGAGQVSAAQFTFAGRTYLAIEAGRAGTARSPTRPTC